MIALTRDPSGKPRLVDAPSDARDDLLDHLHQVRVVVEGHVGQLEATLALDVGRAVCVDEDVGDGRVTQQRLERAEAEHFVMDVDCELLALQIVHRCLFLFKNARDQRTDLLADLFGRQTREPFQFDAIEHDLVDLAL